MKKNHVFRRTDRDGVTARRRWGAHFRGDAHPRDQRGDRRCLAQTVGPDGDRGDPTAPAVRGRESNTQATRGGPHARQGHPAKGAYKKGLTPTRTRFGSLRLHLLLRREDWVVNTKRVHRIDREEELAVRLRRRRKRASPLRVVPPQPRQLNERWRRDCVADTLLDGRRFRALTVVDHDSRHSHIIEPDFTRTGTKVVAALQRVAKRSGYAKMITVERVCVQGVRCVGRRTWGEAGLHLAGETRRKYGDWACQRARSR
jgi:HTH-like domain